MCWTLRARLGLALLSTVILAHEHLVEGHGEEPVNDAISPWGLQLCVGECYTPTLAKRPLAVHCDNVANWVVNHKAIIHIPTFPSISYLSSDSSNHSPNLSLKGCLSMAASFFIFLSPVMTDSSVAQDTTPDLTSKRKFIFHIEVQIFPLLGHCPSPTIQSCVFLCKIRLPRATSFVE